MTDKVLTMIAIIMIVYMISLISAILPLQESKSLQTDATLVRTSSESHEGTNIVTNASKTHNNNQERQDNNKDDNTNNRNNCKNDHKNCLEPTKYISIDPGIKLNIPFP